MAGLIRIDGNNAPITLGEVTPNRASSSRLNRGACVLRASKEDMAEGVVSNRMHFGGLDIAAHIYPGARLWAIRKHQPGKTGVVRQQQRSVHVEHHGSRVGVG